jgi:integrase
VRRPRALPAATAHSPLESLSEPRHVPSDASALRREPRVVDGAGLGTFDPEHHYNGVRFHDLRHTFISLMAKAGVHVSVIAAMVGHEYGDALLLRR